MYDLKNLVYLDLQKTGSGYISAFLEHCCTLDLIKHQQHSVIKDDFNPEAFYFISIRNPSKLYSSLYRYGKQKSGGMFERLSKSDTVDVDKIYESFDAFTDFVLSPQNATLLDNAFTPRISEKYGFASYRFLRLSLQYPMKKIEKHLRNNSPDIELKKQFIHSLVIKNENLNEDIYNFSMNIKPEFFDPEKVKTFLSANEKINTSKIASSKIPELAPSLKSEIERRDALLLEHY